MYIPPVRRRVLVQLDRLAAWHEGGTRERDGDGDGDIDIHMASNLDYKARAHLNSNNEYKSRIS